MKSSADYHEAARAMSDEQLCTMLAHEADYLPNAIEAARAELCRREALLDTPIRIQADYGVRAGILPAWEYRIETLRGVKSLPYGQSSRVKRVCDELGEQGWELVSVNCSWFLRMTVLYFKRRKHTPARP